MMRFTTRFRRNAFASAIATGAVLAAAGVSTAEAATFCVNKSPCPIFGSSRPTIQAALDDAALTSPGPDTVLIGPGTYVESPSYTDVEEVHVIGEGSGETTINTDGNATTFVLRQTPSSTIEGMTLEIPDVSNGAALWWDNEASDIEAIHDGGVTALEGMRAEGAAELVDSSVNANGTRALTLSNATGVVVRDSHLRAGATAISAGSGADLTIERSTITAPSTGVFIGGAGATLNVNNTVLRDTSPAFVGGAMLEVLSGATVVARHLTVKGAGATGAGSRGIQVDATSGNSTLTVFDSIVDGFDASFLCSGTAPNTANLGVSYSNYTDPLDVGNAQCNDVLGAGNDTVTEPDFIGGLLSDMRLRAPSPLIDAADQADPVIVDRLGLLRPIDGNGDGVSRSDMGAYEYQHQAPNASITAPATATLGVPAAFSAAGSGDPDAGDVLTFTWDFGDGGSATGFAPSHVFAAAGTRTVTVTVTDPTGLTATASASVEVPGPPANPPVSAPNTSITSAPTKGQLRKRRAKFLFQASEPGAGFECSLDGKPFAACTSPKTYKRLKPGKHLFAVRAIGAGGADPSPAEKRFKVKRPRR
jgi:PKD repeat protein